MFKSASRIVRSDKNSFSTNRELMCRMTRTKTSCHSIIVWVYAGASSKQIGIHRNFGLIAQNRIAESVISESSQSYHDLLESV